MKRKRENFPFAYLSNASFLQRHTLRLQIILCSGRLDFSTSKVCKKLEALVSHAFVTALMAFWDAPEMMVFRYRETSVLLKSKSLLHFTGRRRAFDTHVCSGCVTKHPDIVPSLLGGPGALAEQKVYWKPASLVQIFIHCWDLFLSQLGCWPILINQQFLGQGDIQN